MNALQQALFRRVKYIAKSSFGEKKQTQISLDEFMIHRQQKLFNC